MSLNGELWNKHHGDWI